MKPARDSVLKSLTKMVMGAMLVCAAGTWGPWAVSAPAPLAPGETASGLPAEQAAELLRSERFRHLASELRCLVCQNQTLADSNAELAGDLRNEVLRQMASGKDDAQIKAHLVDRFGEFVLYRPSFSAHNLALWAGPALLAGLGLAMLWRVTRTRPASAPQQVLDDAALDQIEHMLEPTPGGHDNTPSRSKTDPVRSPRT